MTSAIALMLAAALATQPAKDATAEPQPATSTVATLPPGEAKAVRRGLRLESELRDTQADLIEAKATARAFAVIAQNAQLEARENRGPSWSVWAITIGGATTLGFLLGLFAGLKR